MEEIPQTDKNLKRQEPKEIENFLIGRYKTSPDGRIVCVCQNIRLTDSCWDVVADTPLRRAPPLQPVPKQALTSLFE